MGEDDLPSAPATQLGSQRFASAWELQRQAAEVSK